MSKGWYQHRGLQFAIGILVSLICLFFAVAGLLRDGNAYEQIKLAFARANYATLPVLWLGVAAFYWLKAWRWRLLLRPLGDFNTLHDCLPPTMVGFAANNLLPAHLGDFYRVYLFSQQKHIPFTTILSSAVLERVFDVLAILTFLGLGLALVPGMPPMVQQLAILFAMGAATAVLGAIAYLFWTQPFVRAFEWCLHKIPFLPAGLRRKLCGMLEAGADGLRSLKNPSLVAGIILSSLGQWAINGFQIHVAIWSFGIEVSPLVSCIVLGVVAIGVTLPSSPGYFGVIQLCFMTVLQLFTKDQAAVFGASVYYHLSQYVLVTLTGMIYFYSFYAAGVRVPEKPAEQRTPNTEAPAP